MPPGRLSGIRISDPRMAPGEAAQDRFSFAKTIVYRGESAAPEPPSARFRRRRPNSQAASREGSAPASAINAVRNQARSANPSLAPAIRTIDQTAPSPNKKAGRYFQNAFFRPRWTRESKKVTRTPPKAIPTRSSNNLQAPGSIILAFPFHTKVPIAEYPGAAAGSDSCVTDDMQRACIMCSGADNPQPERGGRS